MDINKSYLFLILINIATTTSNLKPNNLGANSFLSLDGSKLNLNPWYQT